MFKKILAYFVYTNCTFCSFFPILIPSVSFLSNTKQVIPLYPNSGLTLAKTRNIPASLALDIHIFVPFMMNSSSFEFIGLAVVFKAKASDPDSASDKQNDPT